RGSSLVGHRRRYSASRARRSDASARFGTTARAPWELALMPAGLSTSDFYYILPELVLTAGALVVLIADVLLPRGSKALAWVTLLAIGATFAALMPFGSTRVEV